jgi:predicted HTH transcriptional regulator
MIDPHLIFQTPDVYWDYMINNPEGQYFDRKEVRNDAPSKMEEARNNLIECISAFTNSRGGITVLGIGNTGTAIGLDHLSENEYNSLTKIIYEKLNNHQSVIKEWDKDGKRILLVYSPPGRTGICKTVKKESPKGWFRNGANNSPLTQEIESRLLVERNSSFEQLSCAEFDLSLVNRDVLSIFKKRYLEEQGASYTYDDTEFLKTIVAIKSENNKLIITNGGVLFFGNNPTGFIPSAHVRFLKYDCEYKDFEKRGTPIFDRSYDGALPVLLQKIRIFIKEGAYFKTYTYRNPYASGIIDEPELPLNAVEEAIVNAIIHRNYNMPVPIECSLYKDAFVVRNPGSLIQPEHIPTEFTLENQHLISYPRNPGIVGWGKTMKDESGQRFIKALSEGSRTMREAMKQLGLPAPLYHTNGFTTVVLYNNYTEREAKIRKLQQPLSDEFTNLFPIDLEYNAVSEPDSSDKSTQSHLLNLIKDKLQNLDWFIDRDRASRITAHRKGQHVSLDASINQWLRIFPAYTFRVYYFNKKYYLSIDFDIQLKNYATLDKLYGKGITDMRFRSAQVKFGGTWTHGTIQDTSEYYARVLLPEFDRTEDVNTNNIIPSLSKTELSSIVKGINRQFNLDAKLKELSLSSQVNASKERSQRIIQTANYIAKEIFPLSYNGFTAYMHPVPVSLIAGTMDETEPFTVIHSLKEPQVKFADNAIDSNILSGLSKFGSFSSLNKDIEIVPFCISGYENGMQNLIGVIQKGSMNFKGMERTFKMGIKYLPVIAKNDASEFLNECKRLVSEYNWEGDVNLSRIFLIHIPEDKYPVTDINSPYFTLKEFLLEKGIPVQMLDTPTLIDPKFKDFNLALNIVAKTGGTPWVLPNALPDADLFIGLSYAQYKTADQLYRTMGYANVFNKYGQWQYYKGNIAAFNFEDKHIHLAELVRETLEQIQSLSDTPSIYIHYSSKFSRKDRIHIQNAAQRIRPNARVTFVWINTGHNIRMFDNRIEGNGSLSRGSYVITGKNQFYLSTTGYSTLKKTMGTPIMLEVNVTTEPFTNETISYKMIAQHLLALTKLNWASTQSINGEPVTTKYAHDIARLSQVFYRHKGEFRLNKVLERTPWFI